MTQMKQGVFARLAHNMENMGYYRTDDHTVENILARLHVENKTTVLDPCCGEGLALETIKNTFPVMETYGVEIDSERALSAKTRADTVVHASYDEIIASTNSFGMLFLNPPYGDSAKDSNGKVHRLEVEFLHRTVRYLSVGGVLVYIIPFPSFTDKLKEFLVKNFHVKHVFPAAVDTFKQCVFIGVKKHRAEIDALGEKWLEDSMRSEVGVSLVDGDVVDVPPRSYIPLFRASKISPVDVRYLFDNHEAGNKVLGSFEFKGVVHRRPITDVGDGHLGTMIAAGAIDGAVRIGNESFLIKGSTFRQSVVTTSETVDENKRVNTETETTRSVVQITMLKKVANRILLTVVDETVKQA